MIPRNRQTTNRQTPTHERFNRSWYHCTWTTNPNHMMLCCLMWIQKLVIVVAITVVLVVLNRLVVLVRILQWNQLVSSVGWPTVKRWHSLLQRSQYLAKDFLSVITPRSTVSLPDVDSPNVHNCLQRYTVLCASCVDRKAWRRYGSLLPLCIEIRALLHWQIQAEWNRQDFEWEQRQCRNRAWDGLSPTSLSSCTSGPWSAWATFILVIWSRCDLPNNERPN